MTNRYGILRKKLKKLETDLHLLFSLPPDTATHEILSHRIEQQLEFLNYLLAAEIGSCPSKPHHLKHIARRLNELETAFRHWDDYNSQQQLAGNINEDAASVCSCSESCLNDDGEAAVERDLANSPVNYDVPEDSPVVEMEDIKYVEEEEKGIWGSNGRYFEILGCGIMIGAVCMGFIMVRFSDCFLEIQPLGVLTPT